MDIFSFKAVFKCSKYCSSVCKLTNQIRLQISTIPNAMRLNTYQNVSFLGGSVYPVCPYLRRFIFLKNIYFPLCAAQLSKIIAMHSRDCREMQTTTLLSKHGETKCSSYSSERKYPFLFWGFHRPAIIDNLSYWFRRRGFGVWFFFIGMCFATKDQWPRHWHPQKPDTIPSHEN